MYVCIIAWYFQNNEKTQIIEISKPNGKQTKVQHQSWGIYNVNLPLQDYNGRFTLYILMLTHYIEEKKSILLPKLLHLST